LDCLRSGKAFADHEPCRRSSGGTADFFITSPEVQQASALISDDQAAGAAPQKATPSTDDNWHLGVSPYLSFAGVHGTVEALGHNASVHASAADVLSHFNIGLMGAMEARKGRFVFAHRFHVDQAFRR
jgi:hypothetical protein